MPRKIIVPNFDNLISRYQSGEPVNKLLGEWHITSDVFRARLAENNIPIRPRSNVPVSEMISLFLSGELEYTLAKRYGVARSVIRRHLIKNGIAPRTLSQAMTVRMSKLSFAERCAITEASHAVARTREHSIAERTQRAITRERLGLGISENEIVLANMLRERGITNIIPQKAVGVYNIDIAIESPRIAVEIFGGNWHNTPHHIRLHRKRIPYILNEGWNIVIVLTDKRTYPLTVGATDYIISLIQEFSFNKTPISQYRVIWGNGDTVPANRSEFYYVTRIESPTNSI
jgi:very-short-patch-repair endonuclease